LFQVQDFSSLGSFNSSLAQSAGELWLLAKMSMVAFCGIRIFTQFLVFEP